MSLSWVYVQGVLTLAGIFMIAVLGLSLFTGFTGLFSFGHAGFMAIGAYTSVLLTNAGVNFYIALIAAGIVASLISLVIGSFTLGLKGDYFAIATLGLGEAIRLIFDNVEFFGGARGLACQIESTFINVYLIAVIGIIALCFIIKSRHGRNFIAIREEELASTTIGINTFKYKMISLAISAVFAGVAGGLYAHYSGYIRPLMFNLVISQELTIIVIFGGLGSVTGSVVGALVLRTLPEIFREFANWRLVIYGIVIIFIMIARPRGLMGGVEITDLFKRKKKVKKEGASI